MAEKGELHLFVSGGRPQERWSSHFRVSSTFRRYLSALLLNKKLPCNEKKQTSLLRARMGQPASRIARELSLIPLNKKLSFSKMKPGSYFRVRCALVLSHYTLRKKKLPHTPRQFFRQRNSCKTLALKQKKNEAP